MDEQRAACVPLGKAVVVDSGAEEEGCRKAVMGKSPKRRLCS